MYHPQDRTLWTRVPQILRRVPGPRVTCRPPIVALHQAGVADAIAAICGVDTHASLGLLDDDGEDEAAVEVGRFGDAVDGEEDLVGFLRGVVWHLPIVVTAGVHDDSTVDILPIEISQL